MSIGCELHPKIEWGAGDRVQGSGCRVPGFGLRVSVTILETTLGKMAPPTSGHPLEMPPESSSILGLVHCKVVPFALMMLASGWSGIGNDVERRAHLVRHGCQELRLRVVRRLMVWGSRLRISV